MNTSSFHLSLPIPDNGSGMVEYSFFVIQFFIGIVFAYFFKEFKELFLLGGVKGERKKKFGYRRE
jgi:hypothetical protein